MKVDDMDKGILRLLKSDGRMSFTDIAEKEAYQELRL